MKRLLKKILNQVGIDNLRYEYRYELDKKYGYIPGEKKPDKWVKSTCGYCSVGCGLEIGVANGRAITVRPDAKHMVNYGKLCPKGLSEHETISAKNRARYPLMRLARDSQSPISPVISKSKTKGKTKEKFFRVSWDEALNVMTQKFAQIQKQYGKGSIGVISTGQLLTEEFYTLGKLVQLGLETNNYDGNTTLCMSSAVAGYKRSFGSDGPPASYEDFALSDTIVLIGANIAENHPILTCWLQANHDKTVISVDPRVTKTSLISDVHLPLKPHSDIALLNGIMQVIIKEKWYDKKYIEKNANGFDQLKNTLSAYTLEHTSYVTGISSEQLYKVAKQVGQSKSTLIAWTMGVNHSSHGTETVNAINNLSLLIGKVGQPGSSPFSITGQCNAMGSREASFSSSLPGYRTFGNIQETQELASLWNVNPDKIPKERGLAYPDIIEGIIHRKIKALWVIATNPLVSYPNQSLLQDALSRLDFLVVQDGFHPTPTTLKADLVLPAAIWGEKEGTYTNSERRVSKANAAVKPPGEARTDFDIFLAVAKKLNKHKQLFPGWKKPEHAFEEWKKVSKGRLCDYSGMTYSLIEKVGGIQWPFTSVDINNANTKVSIKENKKEIIDKKMIDKEIIKKEIIKKARQTRRLYSNGKFQTKDGKANLIAVEQQEMPEPPDAGYPFILNTGRTVEHWHTRTKTGGVGILEKLSPKPWIEMNPADAMILKFKQGQTVRVVSRRGRIEEIQLRITEIVSKGQVFIPFHWVKANANNLTINSFDPYSREPNYKQAAVRVEHPGEI